MPRYHALDTGIKLCVWDPTATPKLETGKGHDRSAPPSSISAAFSRLNSSSLPTSKRKIEEKSGPAIGYVVDDLNEEYFQGHEGVDFLAPGMPFYLVKAGNELFAGGGEVAVPSSPRGFKDATLATVPSTSLLSNTGGTTSSLQLSDADTSLSSIGTDFSMSGGRPFSAAEQETIEVGNAQQPGK